MTEITKVVEFDMGHRVPNHKAKCRNLHGHRYRMEVTVGGPICTDLKTTNEGMVLDFGDLKSIITEQVHDVLDHKCMLFEGDPLLDYLHEGEQGIIVVAFIPTVENLVQYVWQILEFHIPEPGRLEHIRLFETPNSWADIRRAPDAPTSH